LISCSKGDSTWLAEHFFVFSVVISLVMRGCAAFKQSKLMVDPGSVPPGIKVTRRVEERGLLGNPMQPE
jgi:hypothetical protein